MSVASEITRLTNAKAALKSSIISKGVQVPSSATLDSYSSYVDSIVTGGGSSSYDLIVSSPSSDIRANFSVGYGDHIIRNVFSASSYNAITSATFGDSVVRVTGGCFSQCSVLTATSFASIDSLCDIYFEDQDAHPCKRSRVLSINGTPTANVEIPSGKTQIKQYAFTYCENVTAVTIPSTVADIDVGAFGGCSNLSSITCSAVTAPTLGGFVFNGLPSVGTLYVPYGSDYSSWVGSGATSGNKLASGWTIQYMNAPTSYIELYDYTYSEDYITFNISWQGGSSSVTYNNGYALVEVPIETDITIAPSFNETQYIEDAQCDGTPTLMVNLHMGINSGDEEGGYGVEYYSYMEDPENYPNAVYTYKDPSDSIVINFLVSGEEANVEISSMSTVDFNCEPFIEEPEPEPELEEPIE